MHVNKITQLLAAIIVLLLFSRIHSTFGPSMSIGRPRTGGFEDTMLNTPSSTRSTPPQYRYPEIDNQTAPEATTMTDFWAGSPGKGSHQTRVMVMPAMQEEDTEWIAKEAPKLDISIYIANDPSASRHPPKNKGHEVMIYLSYLIDHYDRLPDIVLFMHSHRWTHHNNQLLGFDAAQMIRALNSAHVAREGYVNMRCHWSPGCPVWLRPTSAGDTLGKQEETVLERCWKELFPFDPVPPFLAQPCCAQFALSKARILAIPRSRYVFYRDWILKTPLSDYVSGRIWEYSWQYLFTKGNVQCPAEHVCYCDGFGICFGGEMPYRQYWELLEQKTAYAEELERVRDDQPASVVSGIPWYNRTTANPIDSNSSALFLRAQIVDLEAEMERRKQEAQRRGTNPRLRAEECGRAWKEGDGF